MTAYVIFNTGYITKMGGTGILSWYPEAFECKFSEAAKILREEESIKNLFKWAEAYHVPASSICLMFRIEEGDLYWEFTVKAINIREYRKYWENYYNKTYKP